LLFAMHLKTKAFMDYLCIRILRKDKFRFVMSDL